MSMMFLKAFKASALAVRPPTFFIAKEVQAIRAHSDAQLQHEEDLKAS